MINKLIEKYKEEKENMKDYLKYLREIGEEETSHYDITWGYYNKSNETLKDLKELKKEINYILPTKLEAEKIIKEIIGE